MLRPPHLGLEPFTPWAGPLQLYVWKSGPRAQWLWTIVNLLKSVWSVSQNCLPRETKSIDFHTSFGWGLLPKTLTPPPPHFWVCKYLVGSYRVPHDKHQKIQADTKRFTVQNRGGVMLVQSRSESVKLLVIDIAGIRRSRDDETLHKRSLIGEHIP